MAIKKSVRYAMNDVVQFEVTEYTNGEHWVSMISGFFVSPEKVIQNNGFHLKKSDSQLRDERVWFSFNPDTWELSRNEGKSLPIVSFVMHDEPEIDHISLGKSCDEEEDGLGTGIYIPCRFENKVFYHELGHEEFDKECEQLFHYPDSHDILVSDIFETMITPPQERTLDDAEVKKYFDDFINLRIFYRGELFPIHQAHLHEETRNIVKTAVEGVYRGIKLKEVNKNA